MALGNRLAKVVVSGNRLSCHQDFCRSVPGVEKGKKELWRQSEEQKAEGGSRAVKERKQRTHGESERQGIKENFVKPISLFTSVPISVVFQRYGQQRDRACCDDGVEHPEL